MSNTSAGCFAMALTDDIDTQVEHESSNFISESTVKNRDSC